VSITLIHPVQAKQTRVQRCPSCDGPPDESHEQWNERTRGEHPLQCLDRAYGELLQEVRVAQTGVQVLLAFLLWLAFTPRLTAITDYQRALYVAALVIAALAIALLIAPACCHRITYGLQLKGMVFKIASICASGGYCLLFCALNCALLLILDVVLGSRLAAAIGTATVTWFALWWYLVPLMLRRRSRQRQVGSVS
jgi:hypothetical protein